MGTCSSYLKVPFQMICSRLPAKSKHSSSQTIHVIIPPLPHTFKTNLFTALLYTLKYRAPYFNIPPSIIISYSLLHNVLLHPDLINYLTYENVILFFIYFYNKWMILKPFQNSVHMILQNDKLIGGDREGQNLFDHTHGEESK